jgi:hypothetical protein
VDQGPWFAQHGNGILGGCNKYVVSRTR